MYNIIEVDIMELIKLRDNDIKEFKKLMQEAFQYGYESVYGEDK